MHVLLPRQPACAPSRAVRFELLHAEQIELKGVLSSAAPAAAGTAGALATAGAASAPAAFFSSAFLSTFGGQGWSRS